MERLAPTFARREPRERARRYLLGLLGRTERKNGWQLAEMMHEPGPQRMQRLLNAAQWDAGVVRDQLRAYVSEQLAQPDGVLVLDETGFLKKGSQSAGVARQYSGTAGRIENQQIGVFLAYSSTRGTAFIDRELYLPEEWTQDRTRCRAAGIPDEVLFAPKTHLAQQMLERAYADQVSARWVVADTVYSSDDLRLWLQAHNYWYVLAVPNTYGVWTAGTSVSVSTLRTDIPADAWVRLSAGQGSKGERFYDWAWLQLPYHSSSGMQHWVVIRRSISDPTDCAYFHAYAPIDTSLAELVRVAGTRWVIEAAFEQTKGEVGLDQYEVRRYHAWYRHITLSMVAHAYLVAVRATLGAGETDLVAVSVPELRRLRDVLSASNEEREHRLGWSQWRLWHQAIAKRCHSRRREANQAEGSVIVPCARILPGIRALDDVTWAAISVLLPARQTRVGRPTISHRQLLEGMIAMLGA